MERKPVGPEREAPPGPALIAWACLLACLLAGCSARFTAANLNRKHWEEGAEQKIQGQYFRFVCTTRLEGGAPAIRGSALPIPENLPVWADAVQSLTLTGYLCDDSGTVLEAVSRVYPAQKIPEGGFAFDFRYAKRPTPQGGFSVAFGYAAAFTASKPPPGGVVGSGSIAGYVLFNAREAAALAH